MVEHLATSAHVSSPLVVISSCHLSKFPQLINLFNLILKIKDAFMPRFKGALVAEMVLQGAVRPERVAVVPYGNFTIALLIQEGRGEMW